MKKYVVLLILLACPFVYSCKQQDKEEPGSVEQIIALTKMKDSNMKILATMLGTSEEELTSIIYGENIPTDAIAERSNELYKYSQENGGSFKRLRAVYDPDFAWYDHILMSPTVHPWWFWIITGLLLWFTIFRNITLSFIRHSTVIYSDGLYLTIFKLSKVGLLVEGSVFLVAYLFSTILK